MAERPENPAVQQLGGWEDDFDIPSVKNWNNEMDIASHYNFSPERLRLFRNGTRQFVQYNSITQFNDAADVWELQPDAGDSMHIESAESGTYVVNYTLQASFALSINQSLQDGDIVRFGPFNNSDGWYLEQRGTDHTDTQVDFIQKSGGTTTTIESDVELCAPLTEFTRFENEYIWYNVASGGAWKQTFSENNTLSNEELTEVAMGGRGPETGNLTLRMEVEASATTTGLGLNAGSMALNTRGAVRGLVRDKPQTVEVTIPATNGVWHPLYAVRIDPDNDDVNANLADLSILSYANNAVVELVAVNFDASNTDASGWSVPDYHHAQNSALQSTTSITTVVDDTGTSSDLSAGAKFGGYTLASAQIETGGATKNTVGTETDAVVEKKNILSSDHLVFLARTGNAGGTLRFEWDARQDW